MLKEKRNLSRKIHQPEKYSTNPVLIPDKPWEGRCVSLYGSVIYDSEEKIFKMWYQTFDPTQSPPNNTLICYAVSDNGIHWEKPNLGIYEYRGSKKNNNSF